MLTGTNQRQRVPAPLSARSAPTSMHEGLHAAGNVVVHNVLHHGHIKAAGSDICGHQHRVRSAAEAVKILQSLPLLHVCVQRVCGQAELLEHAAQPLQFLDRVHEHKRAARALQGGGTKVWVSAGGGVHER